MEQNIPPVPQVPLNPEKSRLAPSNLLALAVNGLVRLEHYRRYDSEAGRQRKIRWQAKTDERRMQHDMYNAEQKEIKALRLRAIMDNPEVAIIQLHTKEAAHHSRMAEVFGSFVTALETDNPPFAKARIWFNEKRMDSHLRKADVASDRLAKAQPAKGAGYHRDSRWQRRPS